MRLPRRLSRAPLSKERRAGSSLGPGGGWAESSNDASPIAGPGANTNEVGPMHASPEAEPVLEIANLSIIYRGFAGDVKAVSNVNLALRTAEVVGLAGESGSGKSTLAYGACRLLRPPALITSGSVTYRGRRARAPVEVLRESPEGLRRLRWREIAIVFQSAMNALNPVLSVRDQLLDAVTAHLHLAKAEALEKVASLSDLVGIDRSRLRSYPHELSGGQRQRVMIAMALAADPEVVIMDEPTTALDVVVQRDILAQVVELQERLRFSIIFITHDLSLLLEFADRIAVMYAGRIVETGSSKEIYHNASHPYTNGLLSSFPALHGPRRRLTGIRGWPPDLRSLPPGCPFLPRCDLGTPSCEGVDMHLARVSPSSSTHFSACPFVRAEGPGWRKGGAELTPPPTQNTGATSRGVQVPRGPGDQPSAGPLEAIGIGPGGTGSGGGSHDDTGFPAPDYPAAGS